MHYFLFCSNNDKLKCICDDIVAPHFVLSIHWVSSIIITMIYIYHSSAKERKIMKENEESIEQTIVFEEWN